MRTVGPLLLAVVWSGMMAEVTRSQEPAGPNVQLVFQVVEADGFRETDPAIAEVVDELRRIFRFEGYRLLETSVLHGTLDGGPLQQRLALPGHGTYVIRAFLQRTAEPTVTRVSVSLRRHLLDAARRDLEDAASVQALGPILDASVNVRDGQTVVLGSARDDPEAGAIILVMRAEFDPGTGR